MISFAGLLSLHQQTAHFRIKGVHFGVPLHLATLLLPRLPLPPPLRLRSARTALRMCLVTP